MITAPSSRWVPPVVVVAQRAGGGRQTRRQRCGRGSNSDSTHENTTRPRLSSCRARSHRGICGNVSHQCAPPGRGDMTVVWREQEKHTALNNTETHLRLLSERSVCDDDHDSTTTTTRTRGTRPWGRTRKPRTTNGRAEAGAPGPCGGRGAGVALKISRQTTRVEHASRCGVRTGPGGKTKRSVHVQRSRCAA